METCENSGVRIVLRSVRGGDGGDILLDVTLENGERSERRVLALDTARYCRLKPEKGELTLSQFEELEAAARLCGAMRRGENLLAYGSNTARNLTSKLIRRGFTAEEARQATEELEAVGLITESENLRREVEKCVRKCWGEGRIRSHLYGRGFGRETLKELGELLEEIDFSALCVEMIRKKYGGAPRERAERDRVTAALCRYGYSLSTIRSAYNRLYEEENN